MKIFLYLYKRNRGNKFKHKNEFEYFVYIPYLVIGTEDASKKGLTENN